MLQSGLIKRVERINRLRLIYALHLTIYGVSMVIGALMVDPSRWQVMMLIALAWLPLLLAHTTAHTVAELRERCEVAAQPVPIQPSNRFALPVILYDEQGNPIVGSEDRMNYLPH